MAQEDRESLSIVSQVLMREGCYLLVYRDGQHVARILDGVPPDLVLIDLNLPGLSGDVLIERMRASKTWRLVPIIVLSSHSTDTEVERAFALGADDFIAKPHSVAEMLARVKKRMGDGMARRTLQTRLAVAQVPAAAAVLASG